MSLFSFATLILMAATSAILSPEVAATDAYSMIQAESFSFNSGVVNYTTYVGDISSGDYVGYAGVQFIDGAIGVSLSVASDVTTGTTTQIQFILSNAADEPFFVVDVGTTHGDNTFRNISEFFTVDFPTGVEDLYLKFLDGFGRSNYICVDWIQFFQ